MRSRSPIQTFDAFAASPYFPALDGLRAVAILMVFFYHAPRWPVPALSILQNNGRFGVSVFFAISGFLICTLLLREQQKLGRINLWQFYCRRALRLLPLYYALLALHVVLVLGLHLFSDENQQLFRQKLPSYVFYYSNWLPTAAQGPFFCAWSLAVEEQFYLLFGLLLSFCPRRVLVMALPGLIVVKALTYQLFGPLDSGSTLERIGFSYQEPILMGVLLAFMLNARRGYGLAVRALGNPWTFGAITLGLACWFLFWPLGHESALNTELLNLVVTLFVGALVLRSGAPILTFTPVMYVGKISYGIYLMHMLVLVCLVHAFGKSAPFMVFAVGSLLTIMAASLSWRYFESRIISFYKQRFSPLNRGRPVPLQTTLSPKPIA